MSNPKGLTRVKKTLYGFGDIGFSLTSTIIGAYFAIFLTDVVNLPPALAAVAIFIGRSWDYINDPLIGHLSDRTRSRWGRRRPFLLFGAVPFALAFILMWLRPPVTDTVLLVIYYTAVYVLYDAAATFVQMPYFSLTPELSEDYDERTSLTSYRMFFSIFGSLLAFTIPLMIIGGFQPQNASRVVAMAVIFAIASAIPLWIVFFSMRERVDFIAQAKPRLLPSIKAALKNKPFIFGAGLFLLTWVSIDILQAGLLFFIKYVLGREAQADIIMGSIFITAILALPLWNHASARWNKRAAYIAGIAFWAVVQLVLIMVNPGIALGGVIVLCVLAGIGVSAAHVLPWSILPDAIEWDEWQTGERHEGVFYSLVTLAQKIASSLAIPLALLILDLSGYVPNSPQQSDSALFGIRMIIGPLPALLLVGGILFAAFYPLNRAHYQKIVAELAQRRAAAKGDPG